MFIKWLLLPTERNVMKKGAEKTIKSLSTGNTAPVVCEGEGVTDNY